MDLGSWTNSETVALAWALPLSAGIVATVSPWGRRVAWILGAIDRPHARKVHDTATPRLGGLSAAAAVLVCVVLWLIVDPTAGEQCRRHWGLFPGAAIMLLLGLVDDLYRIGPRVKLVFQFLAAAVIYAGGIRIETIDAPLIGPIDLGWCGPGVTILWIVGVTNALNFLDGLDGLAAGAVALASASFLLICGVGGPTSMLGLMNAALIGGCAVLVVNNVRPPKSFLGDSGSLLLGALVASTSILASRGVNGDVRLFLPAIVLAVPLIDMVACVIRRLLLGRSVLAADRGHIHHMLLATGFRPNTVAALLCAATALFGACAVIAVHTPSWVETLVVLVIVAASGLVYRRLGYFSVQTWLRYRRANRMLAAPIARLRSRDGVPSRPRPTDPAGADPGVLPDNLQLVLDRIRLARRALGIEYVRVQREGATAPGEADAPAILELGRRPTEVVTTHLLSDGRYGRGTFTVILGDERDGRPAKSYANEQLMLPLLTELAAMLGPERVVPATRNEDDRGRADADRATVLAGN